MRRHGFSGRDYGLCNVCGKDSGHPNHREPWRGSVAERLPRVPAIAKPPGLDVSGGSVSGSKRQQGPEDEWNLAQTPPERKSTTNVGSRFEGMKASTK